MYNILNRSRNFTSIELFLTISIIAALMMLSLPALGNANENIIIEAENGIFDPSQVETVSLKIPSGGNGVAAKSGSGSEFKGKYHLMYTFNISKAGRYKLQSCAALSNSGQLELKKTKRPSEFFLYMKFDDKSPCRRKVISIWMNLDQCIEILQKFELSEGEHHLEIWLPENIILDSLTITPYNLPVIPEKAKSYQPSILPPASHPKLLLNQAIVPLIRKNLASSENKEVWESLKNNTDASFQVDYNSLSPDSINYELLDNALSNAFIYMMDSDKARGRAAVELISKYISILDFGNQLDICRKSGEVIFTASLIYDWCHDLSTADEKKILRENMLRLAETMEIGWPPFAHQITIGHGNEAQLSRDLLSMSIAIYDENPEPYRLCAYRILEELVPYKNFEYKSGRHSQGISYGPYRFSWDLYAAWIFRRMSGKEIFSPDFKKVPHFWLYMRTPNGELMRDGDAGSGKEYWIYTKKLNIIFMIYNFCHDPLLKGEFLRQKAEFARNNKTDYPSSAFDKVMFLLINNPDLKAVENLETLPLTHYFGFPLGSMVCRTGWSLDSSSPDVVVEMKGGGYQFFNHEHLDAGSFQIYYRGFLAVDLGRYSFYGTPYHRNFNTRSIAHNLMLVYDPNENIPKGLYNDGGQWNASYSGATSLAQLITDKNFRNGTILAHDFGPDKKKPLYSYLKSDLKAAYSDKVKNYTRSFCFLNLNIPHYPAVLITMDHLTAKKAEYKKYWQINSYKKPLISNNVIEITNDQYGIAGKLFVYTLLPEADNLEHSTVDGKNICMVFGNKFIQPYKRLESEDWRTTISPKRAANEDNFLNVMVISDDKEPKLIPEKISASGDIAGILIADRIVCFSKTASLLKSSFSIKVPVAYSEYKLLLCDLTPEKWIVCRTDSGQTVKTEVISENGNLFISLPAGEYTFSPESLK